MLRLTIMSFWLASGLTSTDTASYFLPGHNLLLHGRFTSGGVPEIDRTPGYPLFLALTSLLGRNVATVIHVSLSVFTVVLVWRLARAVFGDNRIATGAAWIFAFEPLSVMISPILLSDSLFVALLLVSLERIVRFLQTHQSTMLLECGLWLAAATFVRPVSYYLLFLLALGLPVALAQIPALRWKAPVLLLLSSLPWLGAWQLRNWVETGYGGFSSIAAINLYFYQAARVEALAEHRSYGEVQEQFGLDNQPSSLAPYLRQSYLEHHPEQTSWMQAKRLAFISSESARILRLHPVYSVETQLAGSVRVMLTPATLDLMQLVAGGGRDNFVDLRTKGIDEGPVRTSLRFIQMHRGLATLMVVLAFMLALLYGVAILGMVRSRASTQLLWLLLGTALYFLVVSGGAAGGARYRLPAMPILCIFAANGLISQSRRNAESTHPAARIGQPGFIHPAPSPLPARNTSR